MFVVQTPLEKSGTHQVSQSPRQHIWGNTQALPELIEACQAVQGIPEYQDAPPVADALYAARDWTLTLSNTLSLHRALASLAKVNCIMIVTTGIEYHHAIDNANHEQ